MNLIIAVIKPHRLDGVRESLNDIGVTGMTVTEVKGYGRQKGKSELYRGAEYTIDFVPKIKLDIVVKQEQVDDVIDAISDQANSGKVGDGKIFVLPVNKVMRIRTGELNDSAI